MALQLEPYSDKSFKISGELTRTFKDDLKQYGGRYNKNLEGGPGWIFPNKSLSTLQTFVEQVNAGIIKRSSSPSSASPEKVIILKVGAKFIMGDIKGVVEEIIASNRAIIILDNQEKIELRINQ